jgi:hypothetical protein
VSNSVVEKANVPIGGSERGPDSRRCRANAGFLTPADFLHRLGWLPLVVLSVALAANGLALLASL